MLDRDLALAKMATVERCLARVRSAAGADGALLGDQNALDAAVLNLQRAIQAAIDLAAHVVAARRLGLAASLKETFTLMREGSLLDPALCDDLVRMVGFRNIAVHDYQAIDPAILRSIVRDHLGDLEAFLAAVAPHVPPRAGDRITG